MHASPVSAQERQIAQSACRDRPHFTQARSWYVEVELERVHDGIGGREAICADRLAELSENLKVVGMLQPIIVRGTRASEYQLIAGRRRLLAARMAQMTRVPAIVLDLSEDESQAVNLFENIHRENLSQFEEALVLQRMYRSLGTLEEVARKINKSKAWVSERLQLLDLGPAAKLLVSRCVTSDVDVLNTVNRAARLDVGAAHTLALEICHADKKRDVARRGLESIRAAINLKPAICTSETAVRRDVGRLASEIIRLADKDEDDSVRAREVRSILYSANSECRQTLQELMQEAFAMGREASEQSASKINKASNDLLELIQGRPRHLQQLIIRSYSLAMTSQVFDFQRVTTR